MAEAKELFLRNKKDVKSALAITKDDIFYKMIAYSRAEFMRQMPSREQAEGANNFINILFNLPEEEVESPGWIDSGLHHDLSIPDRTKVSQQQ